jgi:hypothetical protein
VTIHESSTDSAALQDGDDNPAVAVHRKLSGLIARRQGIDRQIRFLRASVPVDSLTPPLSCRACGHAWRASHPTERPRRCPACRRTTWDREGTRRTPPPRRDYEEDVAIDLRTFAAASEIPIIEAVERTLPPPPDPPTRFVYGENVAPTIPVTLEVMQPPMEYVPSLDDWTAEERAAGRRLPADAPTPETAVKDAS